MTLSRKDIPFSPQSPASEVPSESGTWDSEALLEIEKQTNRRVTGWGISEYTRQRGARQVYELRGGKKKSEVQRELTRYKKYGLTGEDVAVLLINQGGLCCGCGVSFTDVDFVIDHCHESGKVRGLLCGPCNIVLVHWMTPGVLRRLASYLEDSK